MTSPMGAKAGAAAMADGAGGGGGGGGGAAARVAKQLRSVAALVADGNYYEAQQQYRTIYYRYGGAGLHGLLRRQAVAALKP